MKFMSWTVFDEENELPTFDAEIVNEPGIKDGLVIGHTTKSAIEILSGGINVLGPQRGFFIEEIRPATENTIRISGRGYEVLTLDEPIQDFVHWYNGKYSDLIKNVIDSSSITKIKYRSVDITDSTRSQNLEVEFDSLFEILHDAAPLDNYSWLVERHGDDFRLKYGSLKRGSKTNPTMSFSVGGKTKILTNGTTMQGMVNRYIINGRPEAKISVTIPNATYPHAGATASQDKLGTVTRVINDSSIEDVATAAALGLSLLDKTATIIKELDFNTTNFKTDLRVGDFVNLVDNKIGLNDIEEVKGWRKKYRVGKARTMFVDLVNVKERSEKDLADAGRRITKRRNDLPFNPQSFPYYRDSGWVRRSATTSGTAPSSCASGFDAQYIDVRFEDNLPADFTPTGSKVFWAYFPDEDVGSETTKYYIENNTDTTSISCASWVQGRGERWGQVDSAGNNSGDTCRYWDNAMILDRPNRMMRLITVVT